MHVVVGADVFGMKCLAPVRWFNVVEAQPFASAPEPVAGGPLSYAWVAASATWEPFAGTFAADVAAWSCWYSGFAC
jgi:hypothetical protein